MPKVVRTPQSPVQTSLLSEEEQEIAEVEENVEIEEEVDDSLSLEDLEPEQALWAGGPSAADALAWKEKYGDVYVTSVTADYHVAWRTINRAEFKTVVKQIEQLVASGNVSQAEAEMINEELVCQICAIYPVFTQKDFAGNLAGLPSILSQQILSASGFTSIDVVQL